MELIATDQGRVLQLFVMEEMRPPSGVYPPDLFHAIAERYGFIGQPTNLIEAATTGAKFQRGHFQIDAKDINIKELGIYNDGIIVDCFNTDDADAVLDELMVWIKLKFELREVITKKQRTYTSVVVIEFDEPIDFMLQGFTKIRDIYASALRDTYGWDLEVNLLRLGISADPSTVPPLTNTQFFVERRIGIPYSQNRYYSGAPFRTAEHLKFLKSFEKVAAT